ncbi:NrdR family transcriptional regulator [Anaerostipes caccae]
MNCPECNGTTKVIDSRRGENEVHRKRECLSCGFQFYTAEVQTDNKGINKCYRSMRPKKNHKSDLTTKTEKGDQAESSRIRKLVLDLEKMILDTRIKNSIGETKEIDLPDIYPTNEIFIAEVTNAMKYRIPLIVVDDIASLYRPIMKFMQANIKVIGIRSIARKINRDAIIGSGTERKTLFGSSTVIKGTGVNMEMAKQTLKGINIVGFE